MRKSLERFWESVLPLKKSCVAKNKSEQLKTTKTRHEETKVSKRNIFLTFSRLSLVSLQESLNSWADLELLWQMVRMNEKFFHACYFSSKQSLAKDFGFSLT